MILNFLDHFLSRYRRVPIPEFFSLSGYQEEPVVYLRQTHLPDSIPSYLLKIANQPLCQPEKLKFFQSFLSG